MPQSVAMSSSSLCMSLGRHLNTLSCSRMTSGLNVQTWRPSPQCTSTVAVSFFFFWFA